VYILTAPLVVVSAPIVNKISSASTLFLCTYKPTEKLSPSTSTAAVTMDWVVPQLTLLPSHPVGLKAAPPHLKGQKNLRG
jgi:hypothetical protein